MTGRRKKKKAFPSKRSTTTADPGATGKVGENKTKGKTNDDALETIFSLIVLLLGGGSNLWFTPDEIAAGLRKVGDLRKVGCLSKLNGFHVRLAINRFSRRGIIATHTIHSSSLVKRKIAACTFVWLLLSIQKCH